MADYHTDFSFAVPITEQDKVWIEEHFPIWKEKWEEDNYGEFHWEFKKNQNGPYMWICSSWGEGDPFAAADWVEYFIVNHKSDLKIGFCWADTCTKPYIGGFGGGGIVVTKDGADFIYASSWVTEKLMEDNNDETG